MASQSQIRIRPATPEDFPQIWTFFQPIVAAGETYAYPMECSYETGLSLWFPPQGHTYVAESSEGGILGSFYLKPNAFGPGCHVANAGYMVNAIAQGQGVGRAMGEFSLEEARRVGFQAMQFNSVVSTNLGAIALWKSLGFHIIGTCPQGFYRQGNPGLAVDTFIMHRLL